MTHEDSLKYFLFMTLEPVHMHKISELAERIDRSFELDESNAAPDIYSLLDELKIEGKVILKDVDRCFERDNDVPFYVVIGLGGKAGKPKRMFCIPLEETKSPALFRQQKNIV